MTAAKEAGHARQADLADFIADHRPHGSLTAHATPPAWNGYRLTVACSCGVTFERWVPRDAAMHRATFMLAHVGSASRTAVRRPSCLN
jgi:hypothetical protein